VARSGGRLLPRARTRAGGSRRLSRTALCFTPDRRFFAPAIRAVASLASQGDADAFDIFVICEEADVEPGFADLDPALRNRIRLMTMDFSALDSGLAPKGRFSRAVFRRLFLDRLLPETYPRYVAIDSDMLIVRPGLARLAEIDLSGFAFAAAYDMIFLMDHKGGPLAREFQGCRRALGLDLTTPYFNAGLMVVDRVAWRRAGFADAAAQRLREDPARFPFMEQDALNSLVRGRFAPLSPRYNFMGDFFLTGLEDEIAPIVLHFVNAPKPWNYADWRGDGRYARAYADWFAASPFATWRADVRPPLRRKPALSPLRRRFAASLADFLARSRFIDA
jgi:lipopolysaccharide biosynthesis glycosyltransferase